MRTVMAILLREIPRERSVWRGPIGNTTWDMMRKGTNISGGGERYHPTLPVDLIWSQENQPKALQAIDYPERLFEQIKYMNALPPGADPSFWTSILETQRHSGQDMFGCTTQLPKIVNGTSHLHNGVACARWTQDFDGKTGWTQRCYPNLTS
jgi:hypothetical protein